MLDLFDKLYRFVQLSEGKLRQRMIRRIIGIHQVFVSNQNMTDCITYMKKKYLIDVPEA